MLFPMLVYDEEDRLICIDVDYAVIDNVIIETSENKTIKIVLL